MNLIPQGWRSRIASAAVFYIFLVVITLAFKVLYLRTVFGREGIARGLGLTPLSAAKASYATMLVATPDVIQLALVTIIVIAIALIIRRWTGTMITALTLAGLLGLVNWFACRQIGTLLTVEHAGVAWSWVAQHPSAAFGFLTPGTLSRLGIAIIAGIVTLVIAWKLFSLGKRPRIGSSAIGMAAIVLALAVGSRVARPHTSTESVVSTPYWSAALASLRMSSRLNPLGAEKKSFGELKQLAGSLDRAGPQPAADTIETEWIRPRYIVILSLETAPLELYPIVNNPEFPAFYEMSQKGLSTRFHFATMPRTTEAVYSILTGMYPVDDLARVVVGRQSRHTFLQTLERNGFETTFIDSFSRLRGWFNPSGTLWSRLGFDRVVFGSSDDPSFEGMQASERRSFNSAIAAIDSARAKDLGAFVVITSAIGHFPWPSRGTSAHNRDLRSARDIMFAIDSLTGDLLHALDRRGIEDSAAVIVTGDHGFRFRAEFDATGREADDPFLTFNVPFLMYAPGALGAVTVDEPTSHVDVAPTLLSLLRIRDDSLLLHGRDLQSQANRRVVFLSSAGLSPYEGFALGDSLYILNTVTGRVTRRATGSASSAGSTAMTDSLVRAILRESSETIDQTLAFQFAKREH